MNSATISVAPGREAAGLDRIGFWLLLAFVGSLQISIAAASILAKQYRDAIMHDLDAELPMYGFGQHKGYGTAAHLKALQTYGVSPVHRTNYAPVRAIGKRLL